MIGTILGAVAPIVDKFVEDKDQKNKLKAELEQSLISLNLAQAQANIEQAKHSSVFVAGARPAIMWIAALGLFFHFIVFPIASNCMVSFPSSQYEFSKALINLLSLFSIVENFFIFSRKYLCALP